MNIRFCKLAILESIYILYRTTLVGYASMKIPSTSYSYLYLEQALL